ncbi:unnamed protein product [Staurois parvus]|uniref:Uncharacterized protein n=1 Tax=Staurois parvus TaxID=386267 RepID=A0ABN9F9R1_9NEOB|nr:unnamed protein product [Staurois parvus]
MNCIPAPCLCSAQHRNPMPAVSSDRCTRPLCKDPIM